MSQPLMLEGLAKPVSDDADEMRALRRQNQRMDEELRSLRNELGQAQADKEKQERSLRALRNQLTPLHRALRAVFGEIELAIGEEEFVVPGRGVEVAHHEGRVDPRWQSWKEKMPGRTAEMIDLLLLHKSMGTKALMSAMHCAKDTVYGAAKKLNAAGLLATSQPYSLKQLE